MPRLGGGLYADAGKVRLNIRPSEKRQNQPCADFGENQNSVTVLHNLYALSRPRVRRVLYLKQGYSRTVVAREGMMLGKNDATSNARTAAPAPMPTQNSPPFTEVGECMVSAFLGQEKNASFCERPGGPYSEPL